MADASIRAGLSDCLCGLPDGQRAREPRVLKKALYLVLAVNLNGQKELLGCGSLKQKGPAFWLSVLTEMQNRGVKDIFIACVDGLTGLPEAIETVYPQTRVQLCMVHLMRNSLRYVSYKHMHISGDRSQSDLLSQHRGGSRVQSGTVCREMGCALSQYQQVVASTLDMRDPVICLPRGHPQGDLYHQCH